MMRNLKLERNLIKTKYLIEQEMRENLFALDGFEYLDVPAEPEMTYEEMLALGDQIGSVSKGLSSELILRLKRELMKKSELCSICLVSFEIGAIATRLEPCGHLFDSECIQTWLEQNKTCPLCLQEVIIQ